MNNCETCRHWRPADVDSTKSRLGIGKCLIVTLLWNSTEWAEDSGDRIWTAGALPRKAFVQDGSDYHSTLWTKPDFGCVQYEVTV